MSAAAGLVFYPFAYALCDGETKNYCWYCLRKKSAETLLHKCCECKTALYCDKRCQQLGWCDHKPECQAVQHSELGRLPLPGLDVRMLARIVHRHRLIEKGGKATRNAHFWLQRTSQRKMMDLWHHAEEMRRDAYAQQKFERIFAQLRQLYDAKYLVDKETAFQLHCRNFINRHGISDADYLHEIAKGLYLDLCAYDHSCAPTAIYTCAGFVATLRALQPGVDLHDTQSTSYTYIDLLAPKQLRQKVLRESWYFACECSRCRDEEDHLLTSVQCAECGAAVSIFEGVESRLKATPKCQCGRHLNEIAVHEAISSMKSIDAALQNVDAAFDSGECAATFLRILLQKNNNFLHKSNVYFVRILQALITKLQPQSDHLPQLLHLHKQAIDCIKLCLPEHHPARAYHFMNIGIFHCQLDQAVEATPFLQSALKTLLVVLGEGHSMTVQCQDWLQKCIQ